MEHYSGPLRAAFFAVYPRETATSDTIAALWPRSCARVDAATIRTTWKCWRSVRDILAGLGRLAEARRLVDSLATLVPRSPAGP